MKKYLNTNYYLECISCHKKTDEHKTTSRCLFCGKGLDVIYDYECLKSELNEYLIRNAKPKVMKYLDFYPLNNRNSLITLDEGGTPLHPANRLSKKIGIKKILVKNEGLNPTGAFKDRGSFVEVNKAKELGFKSVCVASTGNMAASVSAYSAQAGLDCYVFVPENTPRGKLAQCLSYGGKVIQVRGTYTDANVLAEKTSMKYGYYLAGDYVFRLEGQKSTGYEIAEYMWGEQIDWIIIPVGMGTNFSGIWKGLWEYYTLGLIDKLPRLVAVQAEGCNSIKVNINNNYLIKPINKPITICSAIAVGNPLDGPKVINALKKSNGIIEIASDEETLKAQQLLTHTEALYIEPSSATTIVALTKLLNKGIIHSDNTVVCVATGVGLKDPASTLKVLAEPPTVEPDISEVERVINGKLFSIKAGGVKDKEKILFSFVPSKEEIKKSIQKEFSLDLTEDDLNNVSDEVKSFINNKGKNIAKADLQSILETVIQQESKKYLEIVDFKIEDTKTKRPKAYVDVLLNGRSYNSTSEGVGPVDAAISAMKKIIDRYDGVNFKLEDFSVEIPTTGSDSTVEVTMVLKEKNGTQVVEKGTSPDIIVASIDAFVKGYNELVYQIKYRRKGN